MGSLCLGHTYKCYLISVQDDPPHSSSIKFSVMLIPCSENFHDSLLPTEWHTNSLFFMTQCSIGSSNSPVLSPITHLYLYSTKIIKNYWIFSACSLFSLSHIYLGGYHQNRNFSAPIHACSISQYLLVLCVVCRDIFSPSLFYFIYFQF